MSLDAPFPIEIVRTKRKRSVSIQIVGKTVRVTVPRSLSNSRIQDLITQKLSWIKKNLELVASRPEVKPKEYVNDETFPYLGRNYRLKIVAGSSGAIKLKSGYLQLELAGIPRSGKFNILAQTSIEAWYETHALSRLSEKTERYAGIIGVKPSSIKVRDYKSRWGSCSASGDISYNWRIIMAPQPIVDYVVVHELCHILEHNHSSRYWHHVANIMPNHKTCREWLKEQGQYLTL